ncbi:aldo/keto reductase [Sphingomonas sp. ASY06-1R]|uniref:aldo/keto reductase n=1 Tax=Sphingomonas sp. ASY06-1R TaxID=3445771 RepID=UPI003FA339CD
MSSRPSHISDSAAAGGTAGQSNGRRGRLLDRLAQEGPLGLGTAPLGNLYRAMDDAGARATVDAAWDAGVRYFDTAPFYGFGLSERRLGDALRERARDAFLLSTKVGRLLRPGVAEPGRHGFLSSMPFEPSFDYSYDGIMRSFEASLQRLGLARIDILLMHDIGRVTHGADHPRHLQDAIDGGFRAMAALRDQGAVSAIGLGVNEIEICTEALQYADLDLFLVAGRYTLLNQEAGAFFDECRIRNVGIVAAGVFNSGILATGTTGGSAHYDYEPASAEILRRVDAIERLCARFETPLPAAALQFVARHASITTVLIGAGNPAEAAQSVALLERPIPAEFWIALQSEGLLAG